MALPPAAPNKAGNQIFYYENAVTAAIDTLPDSIYPVRMFQVLIIKVNDTALAIIGMLKFEGATNECYPHFSQSMEAKIFHVNGTKISQFINYLASSPPMTTTFYGSHHFFALKINYFKNIQPSTKISFQQALANPTLSFTTGNFTLQRIPDQWVPFNEIEGLKFFLNTPHFYMEIRVHQRDKTLIERQRDEIEKIGKETIEKKQKELQLISAKSTLEEEKREIEKGSPQTPEETQKKEAEIQSINQKISNLDGELQNLKASLKASQDDFIAITNQPALNASCNPILRALSEIMITDSQEASHRLVLCLDKIFSLNQENMRNELFFSFSNETSSEYKQRKLDFFHLWMKFLETHYNKNVTDIHDPRKKSNKKTKSPPKVLVKKEDLENTNLKNKKEELTTLEQLVQVEENFLSLLSRFPKANRLLSNDKSYFISKEQNQTKQLEEKLDGFLHSEIMRLVHQFPDEYTQQGFLFLRDRLELMNLAFIERKLLLPDSFGETRYLTTSTYSKERALLDGYQLLLSYTYFFALLSERQDATNDQLLNVLAVDIQKSLQFTESPVLQANIHLFKIIGIIISKNLPFFAPYKTGLDNLLQLGKAIEQLLKTWDGQSLSHMIHQWSAWKKEIGSLIPLIDQSLAKWQLINISDSVLSNLLKLLPADQLSKDIVKFRRDLKKFTLVEQADQAMNINVQLTQRLNQNTGITNRQAYDEAMQYFTQFKIKALKLLKDALEQFPAIKSRRWLGLHPHSKSLEIKTHFFWAIEQEEGDPQYKSNHTHLPLKE